MNLPPRLRKPAVVIAHPLRNLLERRPVGTRSPVGGLRNVEFVLHSGLGARARLHRGEPARKKRVQQRGDRHTNARRRRRPRPMHRGAHRVRPPRRHHRSGPAGVPPFGAPLLPSGRGAPVARRRPARLRSPYRRPSRSRDDGSEWRPAAPARSSPDRKCVAETGGRTRRAMWRPTADRWPTRRTLL